MTKEAKVNKDEKEVKKPSQEQIPGLPEPTEVGKAAQILLKKKALKEDANDAYLDARDACMKIMKEKGSLTVTIEDEHGIRFTVTYTDTESITVKKLKVL